MKTFSTALKTSDFKGSSKTKTGIQLFRNMPKN